MKARWVVVALVLLVALFAIVIGGFLWPRPQFERGRAPWSLERDDPARGDSLPPSVPAKTLP